MPVSARDVARQVLRRVEQGDAYASLALAGALERARLSGPDRALATELVYGVLRHRTRLDRALGALAPRGIDHLPRPVLVALRVAAYQVLFLRIPAHAAVDDAVRAVTAVTGPRLGGFANALLRKLSQQGEPPFAPLSGSGADLLGHLEAAHSLPRWLGERVIAAVGADQAVAVAEAINRPAPVTLRACLPRVSREALRARLAAERPGATLEDSPFVGEALLMRGAGAPEQLAAFQQGLCTVQDTAAQLVGRLCGAAPGERILDACAGVGGKSTHLAELALGAGGPAAIDAADLSQRKLDLAEDAARRLGLSGVRPVVVDLVDPAAASTALAPSYDRVLLDAPCSGLGVLRRHPEGKWRRRPDSIAELAALQGRLLRALAPRVRPGGVLVYSVCTFTEEEGPRQAAAFLAAHPEFAIDRPAGSGAAAWDAFIDAAGYFRSWPHRHDADAFFAVRLLRRGGVV